MTRSQPPDTESLAEDRTDLAEDRTVMAVERTFAGWMRTAFGAIGIGIAFHALFGEFDPPYLAKLIATVFILLGSVLAVGAERRACNSFSRLNAHRIDELPQPRIRWIAFAVATGALILALALWLLHAPG